MINPEARLTALFPLGDAEPVNSLTPFLPSGATILTEDTGFAVVCSRRTAIAVSANASGEVLVGWKQDFDYEEPDAADRIFAGDEVG